MTISLARRSWLLLICFLVLPGCNSGSSGGGTTAAPLSSNARLSGLSMSAGEFDQIFQSVLNDYTATVSFLTPTTTATPTPEDPNATVTVNSAEVASGETSAKITLDEGANTISVVVTAVDGVTTASYSIDVTRETAATFAQQAYVKASNTDAGDWFGAVALSGGHARGRCIRGGQRRDRHQRRSG